MLPRALTFSAILAAALVVTLGLKTATLDYSVGDDEPRFLVDLEAALREQGFTVAVDQDRDHLRNVLADRGACHLQARDATRAYELNAAFAIWSGTRHRLTYFLGGRRSNAPPAFESETLNVGQRTLARLGLAIARPATIAVLDNGACDLGRLTFNGVKIHTRSHVA